MSEGEPTIAGEGPENLENRSLLQRRQEKEQRRLARAERVAALERPILDRLRGLGYDVQELSTGAAKYAPLPDDFVSVLLDSVRQFASDVDYINYNVMETVVRAIGCAGNPFDARPLTDFHDMCSDPLVKWAICNTLAVSKPLNIDAWVQRSSADPELVRVLREVGFKKRRKPT